MALPQWKSHKIVWGDKIRGVTSATSAAPDDKAFSGEIWVLHCGARVPVSKDLLSRVPTGQFTAGGYYVRYQDGYESWSPAKAFEEGYTRT